MKNKKAIIALIALVAVVAVLLAVYFITRDTPDPKNNPDAEKKTEVVTGNDEKSGEAEKPADSGKTEDETGKDDNSGEAKNEETEGNTGDEDEDYITITVQMVYDDVDKEVQLRTNEEYLSGALLGAELIEGNDSEYGIYITTVDGRVADDEAHEFWGIYKDGEMTPTGADTTVIRDGEHYELILGTW